MWMGCFNLSTENKSCCPDAYVSVSVAFQASPAWIVCQIGKFEARSHVNLQPHKKVVPSACKYFVVSISSSIASKSSSGWATYTGHCTDGSHEALHDLYLNKA